LYRDGARKYQIFAPLVEYEKKSGACSTS